MGAVGRSACAVHRFVQVVYPGFPGLERPLEVQRLDGNHSPRRLITVYGIYVRTLFSDAKLSERLASGARYFALPARIALLRDGHGDLHRAGGTPLFWRKEQAGAYRTHE